MKFYVRHGMIDEEIHKIISFRQNKRYKFYYTKKEIWLLKKLKNSSINYLIVVSIEKYMENDRHWVRLDFIRKMIRREILNNNQN